MEVQVWNSWNAGREPLGSTIAKCVFDLISVFKSLKLLFLYHAVDELLPFPYFQATE